MTRLLQIAVVCLLLLPCHCGLSQTLPSTGSAGPTAERSNSGAAHSLKTAALGSTKNVHQLDNLFLAGQFGEGDIEEIKAQNITRVITLRTEGEIDWDEKAAIEAAGIEFIEIPFGSPESLTDNVFDRVRETLADGNSCTLFHCGSANRVGGVWLPYRVLDQGVDLETAIAEAKTIGLKTPFIKAKALDYIQRKRATGSLNDEASVKPGINDKFIDPELDVAEFVQRFEVESREVFVNREKILAACEIAKGDRIADVGAGTGLFTRMFAVTAGSEGWVYAVDIAPRFIQYINEQSSKQELSNITGVVCAENSVNLPPDSVDMVFICDTYHHFEYPKSTLASIHRALRDDGHLILVDFERIEGKSRDWLLGHVRAGKDVFCAEVQAAGFTLVEEKKIDGFEENYFLKFQKN